MTIVKGLAQAALIGLFLSTPVCAQQNEKNIEAELEAEEAALLAELKNGLLLQSEPNTKKTKTQTAAPKAKPKTAAATTQKAKTAPSSSNAKIKTPQVVAKKAASKKTIGQASVKKTAAQAKPSQANAKVVSLSNQVKQRDAQIENLMAKIRQQRNDLLMAEAEVARLSKLLQRQRTSSLRSAAGIEPLPNRPVKDARVEAETKAQAKRMTPEMIVATVSANKANLRTGPGKNNSPLMTVSKGTRLAVETRNGEWYRVIAPTGARAWVSGSVVAFGKNRLAEPTRTVRVQGYSDSTEEDAFKLLQQSGS